MFYSDYHIHSRFSGDSREDLDEILKKAISLGLKEIAITDHLEKDMIDIGPEWDIDLDEYSKDSREDLDEILKKAISLGLKEIAITDHLEKDMIDIGPEWDIDLDEYSNEILRLKEKYKNEINLKLGLEVGVQPHTLNYFEKELKKYPLDFVIASSHGIDRYDLSFGILQEGRTRDEMQDLYFRTYFEKELKKYPLDFVIASSHGIDRYDLSFGILQEGRTRDEMQDLYFRTVYENVKNYDKFNVYGHLDFITRYGGPKYRGMNIGNHIEIIEKILKEIISKGKGIEINTSGYRYGEDRVYPDFEILKKYFELGGEVITIGSDSHRKEDITKDFKIAYEILERLGVKYISSFEKMEPSFIKIR